MRIKLFRKKTSFKILGSFNKSWTGAGLSDDHHDDDTLFIPKGDIYASISVL